MIVKVFRRTCSPGTHTDKRATILFINLSRTRPGISNGLYVTTVNPRLQDTPRAPIRSCRIYSMQQRYTRRTQCEWEAGIYRRNSSMTYTPLYPQSPPRSPRRLYMAARAHVIVACPPQTDLLLDTWMPAWPLTLSPTPFPAACCYSPPGSNTAAAALTQVITLVRSCFMPPSPPHHPSELKRDTCRSLNACADVGCLIYMGDGQINRRR